MENHPIILSWSDKKPRPQLQTLITQKSDHNPKAAGGVPSSSKEEKGCVFHKGASHPLEKCKVFGKMDFAAKNDVIREHKLCFCCLSSLHFSSGCKATVRCSICRSDRHLDVLHKEKKSGVYGASAVDSAHKSTQESDEEQEKLNE